MVGGVHGMSMGAQHIPTFVGSEERFLEQDAAADVASGARKKVALRC